MKTTRSYVQPCSYTEAVEHCTEMCRNSPEVVGGTYLIAFPQEDGSTIVREIMLRYNDDLDLVRPDYYDRLD